MKKLYILHVLLLIYTGFSLSTTIYSMASSKWLVAKNNVAHQGLFHKCGIGNEINCTLNNGTNCVACIDSQDTNVTCVTHEKGVDEKVAIAFLTLTMLLRLCSFTGLILEVCKIFERGIFILVLLETVCVVFDIITAGVYSGFNSSPGIDSDADIGKLCANLGAPVFLSWARLVGLLIPIAKLIHVIHKKSIRSK
uniref:uncharacterized protein LOC120338269 isoform X1 n=1 Tax=Styela clava TaxID=7725 RepID=UPI00193A5BDF|nr:uncharacterized protein LOC120338269 isoform X1 [Styela clava]